jgi:hypothetical protein
MKNLTSLAVALLGLIFGTSAFAQSMMPPPDPYLDSWSFNDTNNWTSDVGYAPIAFTNIENESCWATNKAVLGDQALLLDSTNPAYLNYNVVETNGYTNLICSAGTIWFWFSPDWSSTNQGGTGPGDWGRFIDVGAWTSNAAYGWWSVFLSPDGNNIYFSGQTNGMETNYLSCPISWTNNSWHLIGLNYTATNSILYVDGQVATNGIGVCYWPGQDVRTNGFWIGSDYSGTEQARGEFVDVETYSDTMEWDSNYFSGYYTYVLPWLTNSSYSGGGGSGGGGGSSSGSKPGYVDGTNLWLQITGTARTGTNRTAYFTIWPPNGVTNGVYDLFLTTNLSAHVSGLNETNWAWVLRCDAGETNLIVTNLTAKTCFFLLGLTNDTDGDGMSDAFEHLVSHTDPNNGDQNSNGIPDGWEWHYFGNLNQAATNDYDGDGVDNYDEYLNGTDPNKIQFSLNFINYYVNTNFVNGTVTILGGVPFYMAVLVNDTNQADADWQPYTSSNVVVTLGSTNGIYNVQVGLRGLPDNAQQTWLGAQLTLNNTGPVLTITNPVSGTVSVPMIQLQGYADESLGSLTFDVSNAAGIFTNQTGYVTGEFYDTNWMAFTTNYFQCYDIALVTNGVNSITLHATDLAGNTTTTNFNFTLDYSANTNPPVLTIVWPPNGTPISGTNFTLQAQVNDATATVTASIVDTNGVTNIISGLVERDGQVWVNNLPLGDGTNTVTVTATSAAGHTSTTSISVVENDVGLTIDPLSQLNQSSVNVTGTVGDSSDLVTVNGVAATVNDDGTWSAANVPASPTGMADLNVQVSDSNGNPLAAQSAYLPQPLTIVLSSYHGTEHTQAPNEYGNYSINWTYEVGGSWSENGAEYGPTTDIVRSRRGARPLDDEWSYFSDGGTITPDGPDYTSPEATDDNSGGEEPFAPAWENAAFSGSVNGESVQRSIQSKVMIVPPGAAVGGTQLYLVQATVWGFSDPTDTGGLEYLEVQSSLWFFGDEPLPPEWFQINGQALVSSGITNDDGSVSGETIVSAPAGVNVDVTPTATQVYQDQDYTFNVQASEVNLQLAVDANRDGNITFDNQDQTSASNPYRFWVNDDEDADSGDVVPVVTPDYENNQIQSIRDLEDFARINLLVQGITNEIADGTFQIGLKWKSTSGSPAIKLWRNLSPNGDTEYLTDTNVASQFLTLTNPGGISGTETYLISSNYWQDVGINTTNNTAYLIFEGCSAGKGQLVITVNKPDGTEIAEAGSVWIDLEEVTNLFEQAIITNIISGPSTNWTSVVQSVQSPTVSMGSDPNLIVFVHGFFVDDLNWVSDSSTIFKRLYWSGYRGKFTTVRWPCQTGDPLLFDLSELDAYKASTGLKIYLNDLRSRFPTYRLNILAHSQGNAITSEAIEQGVPLTLTSLRKAQCQQAVMM